MTRNSKVEKGFLWIACPESVTNAKIDIRIDEGPWQPAGVEGGYALVRLKGLAPGSHDWAMRVQGKVVAGRFAS